ncbi:alpha-1,3-mannosyl-glycoprotein 4-beta-N-acetylglucosaminyltransferase C-like [Chelmon rostratus]|uniref:alpha-1,3-mannosyl-glycoprotein 4-beta-N-acetylglucosaminyltransferase C-like n=1 Tax=Chelmon rostratus TaxID=109905 RepID=UPI001BE67C23|nr:alpha-1,3-mannosyl-glycoprotein 4-beta-N-acetylglucosaminyltransferase C-like [Chelmon rostratus]
MRRYSKKNLVLPALLFIVGLYLINRLDFPVSGRTGSHEPTVKELTWQADRLVNKESWIERGDYLPFNVSYQLLAGAPSTQQRYLSIGLSSVKRKKGSYLIPTLQSIFTQSSPEERSSMVVVVLLADFDVSWRVATVSEINSAFASELEQGQLVVFHVPQDWYPPLTDLKRNYNDAPERVSFRSKQNLDYSFLINYSAGFSQYYLQLEDDVSSARNFFTTIKRRIEEQDAKKNTWTMLEFSSLGYIGKLYKTADLPQLSRFLYIFYQEMPCDWLMTHFRVVMTQKLPIIFKPSLFQHEGSFSSFEGTYNKLKDKDFEELYTNPSSKVYSDMSTYKNHFPKLAWDAGETFFWGRSPEKGNYLTVVFTGPAVVTGISVETGSAGKDLLESAQVEIGHDVFSNKEQEKSCKEFQSVGMLKNGRFEMQQIDQKYSSASSCLRILVTAGQSDWVIIKKIRISTKMSTPPHQA